MAIRTESHDAGLWIHIDRPERCNALTEKMFVDMATILAHVGDDQACKYIVVTGEGRDFCSGGDLGAFDAELRSGPSERVRMVLAQFDRISKPWFEAVLSVPQPIIVGARGHAIGAGAQLVIMADLVVASTTLKLCIPQVGLAHALDHGESYGLPRKTGLAKAMELSLLGETMTATAAERAGLVNWLVDDADLEAHISTVANRLARGAGQALRENKALVLAGFAGNSATQLQREREAMGRCVASPDFEEAIVAFTEKRAPNFA